MTSIYGLCSIVAACNGMHLFPAHAWGRKFSAICKWSNVASEAAGGVGFSTMSLSGITENILNKIMMDSYQTVPTIVPDICWERDTNDFKPFKSYRLTAAGIMKALTAVGELANITLQDETYSKINSASLGVVQGDRPRRSDQ